MLKHVVLFSLIDFETPQKRQAQLQKIKTELEALPALIPSLSTLEVFINENADESYDFMLEAIVPSLQELPAYANHPEHVRVATEYIKPYAKARACVDYTI